jgi:AcrR family transcriptional regulator
MISRAQTRTPGRPRRAAVDAAIVRAAIELMTEEGAGGATLSAVARRAGVARATVYLRWPTRSALIGAAARAAVGGQPMPLTDDVEGNIRFAAGYVRRVFDGATFPALLPEMVRGVLAHPPEVEFDSVAPRRREFARIYLAEAAAQGFDPDVDPNLAFDLILGTAIAYLLANGRAMSEDAAEELGEVIVRGLRRP